MHDTLDGTRGSSTCSNTDVLPSLEAQADNRRRLAELEDEIAELSAQIDAATYRLLCAVSEFDRRDGWHDGFASCAHWLSYRVGISLVTAREKVRVARALDDLPRIGAARATGSISYSKVRELTCIACPENEADLVQLARAGTASHVQRMVRAYKRCEQIARPAAVRQREGRYLSLRTDDDGMLVIEGKLPPEAGALLARALEVAGQALRSRGNDASAEASAGSAGADASAEACRTSWTPARWGSAGPAPSRCWPRPPWLALAATAAVSHSRSCCMWTRRCSPGSAKTAGPVTSSTARPSRPRPPAA